MIFGRRRALSLAGGLLVGAAGCLGHLGDDGRIRWEYDTPASVSTLHDGTLFGREDFQEGSGGVVALDASTGERAWTYGETGGFTTFSRPAVEDAVYFGWGDDAIGSGAGSLHAVEYDGSERWTADTGSVYGRPIVDGGLVFAGGDDGHVYAIDADSGEEAWSVGFEADVGSATPSVVTVDDGVVSVSVEGTIRAFDAEDGGERWSYRAIDARRVRTQKREDVIYYTTTDEVGALADGEEHWTVDFDGLTGFPGIAGGTVYVSRGDGLHAFDAEAGTERWQETAADVVAVHEDGVYAGSEEVRSITPDGETEWSTTLDGSELRSISPADGSVYAITEAGVHRLDRAGETAADVSIADVGSHVVGDLVYVGTRKGIHALEL